MNTNTQEEMSFAEVPRGALNESTGSFATDEGRDDGFKMQDRNFERTFTGADLGPEFTDEERSEHLAKERKRTRCRIPVKQGVTYWNMAAVVMVPMISTLLITY